MAFFKSHKVQSKPIPEGMEPVLLVSICTGETTAAFYNKDTGKSTGVCLIRDDQDLQMFKREYGITGELRRIY